MCSANTQVDRQSKNKQNNKPVLTPDGWSEGPHGGAVISLSDSLSFRLLEFGGMFKCRHVELRVWIYTINMRVCVCAVIKFYNTLSLTDTL